MLRRPPSPCGPTPRALRTGRPPHTPRAHERRSSRAQAPASGHDSPRGAPAAATGFPRPPSPAPPSPGARTAARRGAFPHLLPLFPSGPQASTCTPAAPPNSKGPPSSSGRHHPARGTQSSFHHRRRGSGRSRDTQRENPRRPLPPPPPPPVRTPGVAATTGGGETARQAAVGRLPSGQEALTPGC